MGVACHALHGAATRPTIHFRALLIYTDQLQKELCKNIKPLKKMGVACHAPHDADTPSAMHFRALLIYTDTLQDELYVMVIDIRHTLEGLGYTIW